MKNLDILSFPPLGDERGHLVALEQGKNIPFDIKRVYYLFGTKEGVRRGYHAHRELEQVLVCVTGSCAVLLDDGKNRKDVILDASTKGLVVSKHVWHEMYDFTPDCVLLVLASDFYDESDYIRDYQEFVNYVKGQ